MENRDFLSTAPYRIIQVLHMEYHRTFLLYINGINNNIQSLMRLSADDSVLYRTIMFETDSNILNLN